MLAALKRAVEPSGVAPGARAPAAQLVEPRKGSRAGRPLEVLVSNRKQASRHGVLTKTKATPRRRSLPEGRDQEVERADKRQAGQPGAAPSPRRSRRSTPRKTPVVVKALTAALGKPARAPSRIRRDGDDGDDYDDDFVPIPRLKPGKAAFRRPLRTRATRRRGCRATSPTTTRTRGRRASHGGARRSRPRPARSRCAPPARAAAAAPVATATPRATS